jgi:hypothetical protein
MREVVAVYIPSSRVECWIPLIFPINMVFFLGDSKIQRYLTVYRTKSHSTGAGRAGANGRDGGQYA